MAFLAIKYFIFKILSYIFFNNNNKTSIFTRGYFTILFGLGLGLFPLALGLIYTPPSFHPYFIIGGLILCIISFLLIFYKTSQIFLNKISSFFYIILYLCTLEILPIVLVLKALIWINTIVPQFNFLMFWKSKKSSYLNPSRRVRNLLTSRLLKNTALKLTSDHLLRWNLYQPKNFVNKKFQY